MWSIADLLRGDFKQYDFGKVILPFTVLRRLDRVLAPTKATVLERYGKLKGGDVKNLDPILNRVTGVHFHNVSKLDFARLLDDPNHIAANLLAYIKGFSENVQEIFIERSSCPSRSPSSTRRTSCSSSRSGSPRSTSGPRRCPTT
ncbi:MAG: type I restriction-modification system subunit M N-terminal domain-containing protein [Myxococcales bacterium]|nr:type I restriction-modification system subunit M N-terminal domain-containing protein [Myxococcales bacterium]